MYKIKGTIYKIQKNLGIYGFDVGQGGKTVDSSILNIENGNIPKYDMQ